MDAKVNSPAEADGAVDSAEAMDTVSPLREAPQPAFSKIATRAKCLSRMSLINALRIYASNEAMNSPTFDVIKEAKHFGMRKRQKR